ncbi:MAG: methyltransferase [Candidatus Cloacimonetes bacterium]|nr:methyltransferase [Candidatus Cloacimonadota bacterium]
MVDSQNTLFYDAGAGFCQYSYYMLKKFPQTKVFATDLKTIYLNDFYTFLNIEQQKRFSYTTADLQEYSLINKADLIIAVDILEHINDDISTIKNFYNSLKQDGYLIISTPSNLDKAAAFTAEHVRPGYSPNEICDKLINQGFKNINWKYTYGIWGKIYWLLVMKTTLKLINYTKYLMIIIPFYFLLIFIPVLICMYFDTITKNPKGNGIIITAQKKNPIK